MEKILKEIKKNLKGLNKDELDDILAYYEELINDRLDSGESLKEIEESLNYKEIRSEFLPKSLNKRENIKIKESIGSSNRLLIFLLTSPIWIPLGITYLVIIFSLYIVIFSLFIAAISIPFAVILELINRIVFITNTGSLLISIGASILLSALTLIILINLIKLCKNLNNYLIKLFSNITLKGVKKNEKN